MLILVLLCHFFHLFNGPKAHQAKQAQIWSIPPARPASSLKPTWFHLHGLCMTHASHGTFPTQASRLLLHICRLLARVAPSPCKDRRPCSCTHQTFSSAPGLLPTPLLQPGSMPVGAPSQHAKCPATLQIAKLSSIPTPAATTRTRSPRLSLLRVAISHGHASPHTLPRLVPPLTS